MKKVLLAAAFAGITLAAGAQNAIVQPSFLSNWSVGVDGGLTTPLKGHSFFQNMRSQYGLHVAKQITPVLGVGVEGAWGVNTSSSKTAFDSQYVGLYGTVNLMNAFCGYQCAPRKFWVDAVVGGGWGHQYVAGPGDNNSLNAKAGLNFNYALTDNVSISLKPDVNWRIADDGSAVQFNAKRANFDLMVGVNYNFGPGFECAVCPPDLTGELALANERINELRAGVVAAAADLAASNAANAALEAQLAAALSQPAQVKVVSDTTFSSVRFVFFRIGQSKVSADQLPNVEMIADYMKHNPESTVVIKGYASQDGNLEFNERLAKNRAESVKDVLIKKYGVKADRIKAEGQGIGHMFKEESWNRVAICTLDEPSK